MRTPVLFPVFLLFALAATLPAAAQSDPGAADGGEDERPSRFSPAAMVERIEGEAGRSPIPQPGEGFPKALSFATDAPISVPFVREGQIVPWARAHEYLGGDVITVEGRVDDAFQIPDGPCLLKFDGKNRNAFYIAAFSRDWTGLPSPPERHYLGRTVRVTGSVEDYKGTPQIKAERESQIEVVGG